MTVRCTTAPVITISATPLDTLCAGSSVGFSAATTGGGALPAFTWYVNGALAGGTSTYTYTPSNGDSVRCVLTGSEPCTIPATQSSNTVNMVVDKHNTPVITLPETSPAYIGDIVTISAAIAGAGSDYVVHWLNDAIEFSTTTGPTVTYVKTAALDSISALLVSYSGRCLDSSVSTTDIVRAIVIDSSAGEHNITVKPLQVYPNPATNELTVLASYIISKIAICDMPGREIYRMEYHAQKATVRITDLPAGVYLLTVSDEKGSSTIKKIVKD
jgi:hypothetical protein